MRMAKQVRPKGEDVRSYILSTLRRPKLSARVAQRFKISRQAVNQHIHNLESEGAIVGTGASRARSYRLAAPETFDFSYVIEEGLDEDQVWRRDIRPLLDLLPENVRAIWQFAFTEMFNNAVDHSDGTTIDVRVAKNAVDTEITLADDGVGIFAKIQRRYELEDERQAILELSKGKLTTDSKNHSGQGIFFTSRVVSGFDILSGGVYFSHELGRDQDWMSERQAYQRGTAIFLKVSNHTARSVRKVMNQYSVGDTYSFNKTIVPVKLARYGTDQLVSRSQAKRVLARFEQFSTVVLDFSDVDTVGQAFADQIFRVFASEHPEVILRVSKANPEVLGILNSAIKSARPGFKGLLNDIGSNE